MTLTTATAAAGPAGLQRKGEPGAAPRGDAVCGVGADADPAQEGRAGATTGRGQCARVHDPPLPAAKAHL